MRAGGLAPVSEMERDKLLAALHGASSYHCDPSGFRIIGVTPSEEQRQAFTALHGASSYHCDPSGFHIILPIDQFDPVLGRM